MTRAAIGLFFVSIILFVSACGGGSTSTSTTTPSTVRVNVLPATVNVSDFHTHQFTATVTGSSNTAVTWEVSKSTDVNPTPGGSQKLGFISSTGLYVAPAAVPTKSDSQGNTITTTLNVTAVSQADATASGTSTVTIVPDNANALPVPIELGSSGSNAN